MEEMTEFRISLPNEPGQLARVGEALGTRGVNILTVAAIGTVEAAVALVTDQEDKTREALGDLGLSYQEIELLAVSLSHQPGELGVLAKKLADADINIESMYLLEESAGIVKIAITVNDLTRARQVLDI